MTSGKIVCRISPHGSSGGQVGWQIDEVLFARARFRAEKEISFRTVVTVLQSKIRDMKKNNLLIIAVVGAGLTIAGIAQAHEGKHEEQSINQSDVPAAVQQAAQTEAKGQNIVRWEKEGANYEAVVNESGKEMGITFDPNGKVLSRHNEAKEHQHEGSKY